MRPNFSLLSIFLIKTSNFIGQFMVFCAFSLSFCCLFSVRCRCTNKSEKISRNCEWPYTYSADAASRTLRCRRRHPHIILASPTAQTESQQQQQSSPTDRPCGHCALPSRTIDSHRTQLRCTVSSFMFSFCG